MCEGKMSRSYLFIGVRNNSEGCMRNSRRSPVLTSKPKSAGRVSVHLLRAGNARLIPTACQGQKFVDGELGI